MNSTGTIKRVFFGEEDHGILTISVVLEGEGWGQSFGNLALNNTTLATDFARDLCAAFDVKELGDLEGLQCKALYCFPYDTIEGLEALSGKRFIITEWRRKHWPNAKDPLEQKRESLERSIVAFERQIEQARLDLKTLESRYTPVLPP